MRMRLRPSRGQFYLADGVKVQMVEVFHDGRSDMCSVILPNGKLGSVSKSSLDLPIIETKDYEKI